ncbi:MAG TPA: glycoside hydrolase family 140 protein [Lacunisphaera sp.]|nr:glycoside hydrolase family 140 protein [Lacunisphaera sp.]
MAAPVGTPVGGPAGDPALPPIQVHADGHYLQTADGRPFFWLGDTAWELVHRTTRDECSYYLRTRARQGFNVIQVNVLAEMSGLRQPTPEGLRPFADDDPARPNEAYFDRVVQVVDEAGALGLYVALLPAWGDKLTAPWGEGPRLFTLENLPAARSYARYLGGKLKGRTNVVWMLGGDRPAALDATKPNDWPQTQARASGIALDTDWRPIWREIAAGLADGTGRQPVCLYHPQGGAATTSVMMPHESWLSIHGMQSGHGGGHDQPVWNLIARDFALNPAKPTMDLEPNYEDHPVNPWPDWDPATGYFRDHDVRKQCYRSVFAGGCGVTYGHHAVWQFASKRNGVINHADRDWVDALHRPGATQMIFLRRLLESRPFFTREPDAGLVSQASAAGAQRALACRDRAGTYALVYVPTSDQTVSVDLGRLAGGSFRVWWYDPRTGFASPEGMVPGGGKRDFRSPGHGPDWVLVLDAETARYAPPGS